MVSPQNSVRGISCGLIAFSLMLLGFCAYASAQTQATEYVRLQFRAIKPFDPNAYFYQIQTATEAGWAISACAYGVGFAIFMAGGIIYSQQSVAEGSSAESIQKGDPNFGVSP
mmetsp:Transcript_588/g.676  ORF Transcript_588/g.676 Transcript_588/m.676 type:complete len:113 (-) Transcript_588:220-558(-)|eukprot:CAMPEP_0119050988 /NCGR_PEP_ID=MMETSP1177-20130426/72748_1 /TAXON_ID=2985 /ORGANISM="Ochromonas sp, Strain CCMP1899" /LENGTH=112 /DNA_ID=CAMNT_0007030033 /DNA_START=53 /DNA_END=391 /DNA_ORIENTATION=+